MLTNARPSKLERLEIFRHLDVFTAGTFKFDLNPHHSPNMQDFDQKYAEEFYNRHYPKQPRRIGLDNPQLRKHLEETS
jgi:hypothetical protein